MKKQDAQIVRNFWISQFRLMTLRQSHLFRSLEPDAAIEKLLQLEEKAKAVIEQTLENIRMLCSIASIMLIGSCAAGTNPR